MSPEGRRIDSALDFADALLDETGVAVVPGEDFLGPGPRHIRMSFATAEEQIVEGCGRIREWLGQLVPGETVVSSPSNSAS